MSAFTATQLQTGCANVHTVFSIYSVAGIAKSALDFAFRQNNILSGFGIYPLNDDMFKEEDFAACEVFDRPLNSATNDSFKFNIAKSPYLDPLFLPRNVGSSEQPQGIGVSSAQDSLGTMTM